MSASTPRRGSGTHMEILDRESRVQARVLRLKSYFDKKYPRPPREDYLSTTTSHAESANLAHSNRSASPVSPGSSSAAGKVHEPTPSEASTPISSITLSYQNTPIAATSSSRRDEHHSDLRQQLEEELQGMNIDEEEKQRRREIFLKAEADSYRDENRRLTIDDFEPLALIGKGAFGEVRLVRMRGRYSREIYGECHLIFPVSLDLPHELYCANDTALKSMAKQAMIVKNQVVHVKAERDILTESENPWIVTLYYSFQVTSPSLLLQASSTHLTIYMNQDERNLYMVMEFLPGGDLMGLLMKYDVFPEEATKFFIAELILAVGSVHALGYIHRDLKPDNMYVSLPQSFLHLASDLFIRVDCWISMVIFD
jgi:hypothetical protein